jgi:LacI family transcriptional regulator, galactose operon repressor
MATTIHDVARVAGVGIGTVSRVINNSINVKPVTREKVLAAIAQLNYRPNPIARSMISKRTGSVGVVAPFFTRCFFVEVLKGVEAILAQLGKDLVLYSIEANAQRDRYFAEVPERGKVDGLLILSLIPAAAFAHEFIEKRFPVVLIDAYSPLLTSVVVNNIDGARQAVRFLIDKGHRHIGFINGIIEGNFKFNQANDRLIGLHRALGEAGLLFEPEFALTAEWSREGGRGAALQLLEQKKRPSAIFAASDIQAVGVLEAARMLNIAVPAELSVIGYDGIELSELLELTTVQQPMQYMGELGVEELMERIEQPDQPPRLMQLNTRLIERRTTASAPGRCGG